ncbi:polysaccharide deacetylase family protein [Consotaella salsifontis]|uniref:Chitooligosaccharide deacetylase n=1 Tax=Consotaella salsifontis TaxID=1365950 RepID=A0A1T4MRJ3_9HYPH|nr:polysaccharide deacetylase family protein [Consotaella salsifontis]SJZ69720.1 Peptidoglycan/xylan/chitin deacetylase, PgdA/CDA1 family [Consotaella salsifontis]
MRCLSLVLATVLGTAGVSGCAQLPREKPVADASVRTTDGMVPLLAFASPSVSLSKSNGDMFPQAYKGTEGPLTGRTLPVSRASDIVLKDHEVILTFDDGPMPGKTTKILDALDHYGVKATFMMVGQMARTYPAIVRQVAARGHTIGNHTEDHKNLASLKFDAAMDEIKAGDEGISAALRPLRTDPIRFFRFPYLASTKALRDALAGEGVVVVGADVDSKDYFISTPEQVKERALSRLEARGKGIILFHDIHGRTAAMLPDFLKALQEKGYKVVRMVPARSLEGKELVASAEAGAAKNGTAAKG